VILVDANLLIYAVVRPMPQHEPARTWLEATLAGSARVGLAWTTVLAFLRLVSNPRVLERPVPLPHAWSTVRGWLGLPNVWVPGPTPAHADVLGSLLEGVSNPQLVPDAHLAALAIEHGLTVCSNDSDFARFSEVRWENPLAP
jgi:toxin-antitoxin system PIN domain toxin